MADITYIETQEGWLYLAAILDLYSRKIVGWAMSEHIDTALVLKALGHGSPASPALRPICCSTPIAASNTPAPITATRSAQAGLVASMSRKGNCYDNATMESFWSTLKLELVYRRDFDTRAQARSADLRLHRNLLQSPARP